MSGDGGIDNHGRRGCGRARSGYSTGGDWWRGRIEGLRTCSKAGGSGGKWSGDDDPIDDGEWTATIIEVNGLSGCGSMDGLGGVREICEWPAERD